MKRPIVRGAGLRKRGVSEAVSGGLYFAEDKKNIQFIRSGSLLLDLALGGGWAMGRVANLVGDRSTGKTLLAMEAAANCVRQYPNSRIVYKECESAFDVDYAKALGIPMDRIELDQGGIRTVETLMKDIDKEIERKTRVPVLYVVDSLDAISDDAEMEKEIGKGDYGAKKPKLLSEFFRTRNADLGHVSLFIVSQVRDNLNAGMFGKKHVRSGGKALDFFASQIQWLYKVKTLTKTVMHQERAIGVRVKAKNEKNKISLPFRECEFNIRFGYGVEDRESQIEFLEDCKVNVSTAMPAAELEKLVKETWYSIDKQLLPEKGKYA